MFFGSIRPYKGLETALRAFSIVSEVINDSQILIAGSLWEDWALYDKLIEELGIKNRVITHLKYIPSSNVHYYFESSDLVILPYTHFESQSGLAAIALSFNKPMIVSDVGGLPDMVADSRFIVQPKDPLALSKAMITCLKDEALLSVMAIESEKIAKILSWPHITNKTVSIYTKVLTENKGMVK